MSLAPTQSSPVGLYQLLVQPLMFRLDPEHAHHLTLGLLRRLAQMPSLLKLWQRWRPLEHAALQTRVAGVHFPNPVGLAAGFDKNATAVAAFPALVSGCWGRLPVTPRARANLVDYHLPTPPGARTRTQRLMFHARSASR